MLVAVPSADFSVSLEDVDEFLEAFVACPSEEFAVSLEEVDGLLERV
jgi:hypothetical protein